MSMTRLLNRRHAEHPLTPTHNTHMSQTNERPVDASHTHTHAHETRLCVYTVRTHIHTSFSASNVCGRKNRMQSQSIGRQSQRQGTRGRWTRGDHRPNHTHTASASSIHLMTSHFRPRDDGQGVEKRRRHRKAGRGTRGGSKTRHTDNNKRTAAYFPASSLVSGTREASLRSSGLARIRILCPMVRHSSFFM